MKMKNMNKAVFLDRDGVINRERGGWVYRLQDFEINKDIPESLLKLQKAGFYLFVVTNQSGIDKGVFDHKDVETVHGFLDDFLKKKGIFIREFFYCPHHDETGKCLCRKPDSIMLEKGIARYNIDVSRSFLIGDKERDIMAAEKVGVKGILVKADESLLKIADEITSL